MFCSFRAEPNKFNKETVKMNININPDVKLNIDKYNVFSPVIAASLTNAIICHSVANRTDNIEEDMVHSTHVVMTLWGELCSAIDKVSQKKVDDQTPEK
jgi:hypothetical protein